MFQDTQQPQQVQPEQPIQSTPESSGTQQTPAAAAPATPPPPPVPTTQEERIWSAIGYIAFLGLLTLAIMPKSEFCKKHAAQGLTNFVLWFVLFFLILLLLWPVPILMSLLLPLLSLGSMALGVYGIIRALQSYEMNIPVFTPIALKFPVNLIIGTVTGKTPEPPQGTANQNPPPPAPPSPPAQN